MCKLKCAALSVLLLGVTGARFVTLPTNFSDDDVRRLTEMGDDVAGNIFRMRGLALNIMLLL